MEVKRATTIIRIFLFIILLAGCATTDLTERLKVIDIPETLSQLQRDSLLQQLEEFKQRTNSELVVYLTNDSTVNNADTYATDLYNKLGIGTEGINNGILIYANFSKKQLVLRLGYGMEWNFSQHELNDIVSQITTAFEDSLYFQGLRTGIIAIQSVCEKMSWQQCDESKKPGCIQELVVYNILRDPKDTLFISSNAGEQYIRYTPYMDALVSSIKVADTPTIYCRSTSNPRVKLLLGIRQRDSAIIAH